MEKGLLENTVEAIAAFLKNDDQTLDKTAIGEYLGEGYAAYLLFPSISTNPWRQENVQHLGAQTLCGEARL